MRLLKKTLSRLCPDYESLTTSQAFELRDENKSKLLE